MILVYATGQPGFLEFATASNHGLLPSGATILAIAYGERTTELLDEHTFNQMTDEEYYALQGMLREVLQHEQRK
jgi:uroporphyrinogen-III synthase